MKRSKDMKSSKLRNINERSGKARKSSNTKERNEK